MKGFAGKFILVLVASATIIFSACDEESLDKEGLVESRPLTQEETFLVESSNLFAFNILNQNSSINNQNISFSPISAGAALGIVGNTLSDQSFEKFKKIVGLPDLSLVEINKAFYELSTMAPLLDEQVDVRFSNSLWTQYRVSDINDVYSKMLAYYNIDVMETYSRRVFEEKFISKWIQTKSDFRFDKIEKFNTSVPFQIINLSQFQGSLFNNDKAVALTLDFIDNEGKTHATEMNCYTNKSILVKEFPNMQKLELPIGNGEFLLEIILSNKYNNYVSNDDLGFVSSRRYNSISLPDILNSYEFIFDDTFSKYQVNDFLAQGLEDHFPENQLISTSTFINKSSISITGNKRTISGKINELETINDETNFIVDNPFFYLIKERNSGLILFEGKYNSPEF